MQLNSNQFFFSSFSLSRISGEFLCDCTDLYEHGFSVDRCQMADYYKVAAHNQNNERKPSITRVYNKSICPNRTTIGKYPTIQTVMTN